MPATSQDLIRYKLAGLYQENIDITPNRLSEFVEANSSQKALASRQLFQLNPTAKSNAGTHIVRDALFYSIAQSERQNLLKSKPQSLELSIPLSPTKEIILDLIGVEVASQEFVVSSASGQSYEYRPDHSAFYRGIIKGNPNSLASISIFRDEIQVLISDQFGNYILGPKTDDKELYVLFNDRDFAELPAFDCFDASPSKWIQSDPKEVRKSAGSADCVQIYVEADHTTYDNMGKNLSNVVNYVHGFFNGVATIYQNEGIPIQLSEVKVWDQEDPYSTSCSSILSEFNITGFNGDLAHLITAKSGNSFCGISWLLGDSKTGLINQTTICSNRAQSYSQTTLGYETYPSYSWTVNIFSHEMGHSFGSPHTHQCMWGPNNDQAIDNCGGISGCDDPGAPGANQGTIMSYCHKNAGISLSAGFGDLPGDHIREQYASVSCLTSCSGGSGDFEGCTDSGAHNYNPSATADNGSCQTCEDGIKNGDEVQVDCGGSKCPSCQAADIPGCTDPGAHNYNPNATLDNGSCKTCQDGIKNGDETKTDCGGSKCAKCPVTSVPGCTIPGSHNYNPQADFNNGSCQTCYDGKKNGDEEEIDCGGIRCTPCDEACDPIEVTENYVKGFESGIGIWIQSDDDDFDWSKESGSTPTNSTGPDKAAEGNFYMYTEASGENNPFKTAIIESPCLDISSMTTPYLNFALHMWGETMGSLQIDVAPANGSGSAINVFEYVGNLPSDDWYLLDPGIDLTPFKDEEIKIILTGTTGERWSSDIAFDYFHIYEYSGGACSDLIQNGDETGIDCGGSSCNPCPCTHNSLTLAGTVQDGTVERVKQTIKTHLTQPPVVKNTSNVELMAGSFIELNKGFEVESGSTIIMSIDQCDDSANSNTHRQVQNFKILNWK